VDADDLTVDIWFIAVLTLVLYSTADHLVTLACLTDGPHSAAVSSQCSAERVELTVWGRHWFLDSTTRQQLVQEARDRTLRCYATSTMVAVLPNGMP